MKYSLKMSFIITTLFIVSCIIVIANCGDFYEIDGRTYYTSYPEKKNWNDAMLACAAHGTLLVDVPTADENARLLSVIKQTETKHCLALVDWWTSGSDQKNESIFIWETTGNPVVYTYWHTGEPSNGNGVEHCLAFYRVPKHGWNDNNCTESLYFICRSKQVELPVVVPVLDPVVESVEVEDVVPVTDQIVVPTNVPVVVPVFLPPDGVPIIDLVKIPATVPVVDPVETPVVEDYIDASSGVHRINRITGSISVICFSLYIVKLLW